MGQGELALIVRRPAEGEREVLSEATLGETEGVVGDRWRATDFGDGPEPFDTQLTLMNARAAGLVADERETWPPARISSTSS